MLNLTIEKGAAKYLMFGLIVWTTGMCYFLTIGDPDLLDAIRNAIYEDRLYFEVHNADIPTVPRHSEIGGDS